MNNKKFAFLILIFNLLLLTFLSEVFAEDEFKNTRVVAFVNGVAITNGELNMEVNRILPQEVYHRRLSPEKKSEIEKKALEELIKTELFYQEAKRLGLKPDRAELDKRIKDVKSAYPSQKAFEEALGKIGMTVDSFEAKVRKSLLVEKLLEKEVRVSLGDKDIEDYYAKDKEKFREPEAVRLRYIYIKIDTSDPNGRKKAKEKAKDAYSKIKAGLDFAAVAQNYSADMSRVKGGDVGFIHKGSMPPEVESVAFTLKPGQISEVLESDTGYHILKVEEKRAPRQVLFKDIKDKLKKELTESLQKKRIENLVNRLRGNARIEYIKR